MDEAERQRVFDDWLQAHEGLLFKVVRAYAFTAHDREDLFQEIALQLWNSIPRFRRESRVTTWVYRVALYTAMPWSRKERTRRDTKQSLDQSEHRLAKTSVEADPRLDWIYEQISRLDPVDRSLILLHLDGLPYRDIAATLGISESHVGVKLNRIKKSLASKTHVRSIDGL